MKKNDIQLLRDIVTTLETSAQDNDRLARESGGLLKIAYQKAAADLRMRRDQLDKLIDRIPKK